MPVMIRPDNKAKKIAHKILGTPPNQHESNVKRGKKMTLFDPLNNPNVQVNDIKMKF